MTLRAAIAPLLVLTVACANGEGANTGVISSTAGSGGSAVGSSGSGGTAGTTNLDCAESPQMSRGDIGAYPIDQSHDGRIWGTPSNWGFSANVGGYEVNAWGPPGRAHLYSRKTEMHLCADDVAWTGPDESGEGGSAQLGEFSTLGRCEDAAGETITLNYCRVDGDYQGTPPTECPRHEVHVWTSSGSSAVDETFTFHSGGGVYIYTPINNLHAHFGRGGELSIWWDKASEVTRGFLRAAINGEYAVYCILSTDNQSEDALNRLSFQAKKLGTCPAEPIEGDLAICF